MKYMAPTRHQQATSSGVDSKATASKGIQKAEIDKLHRNVLVESEVYLSMISRIQPEWSQMSSFGVKHVRYTAGNYATNTSFEIMQRHGTHMINVANTITRATMGIINVYAPVGQPTARSLVSAVVHKRLRGVHSAFANRHPGRCTTAFAAWSERAGEAARHCLSEPLSKGSTSALRRSRRAI